MIYVLLSVEDEDGVGNGNEDHEFGENNNHEHDHHHHNDEHDHNEGDEDENHEVSENNNHEHDHHYHDDDEHDHSEGNSDSEDDDYVDHFQVTQLSKFEIFYVGDPKSSDIDHVATRLHSLDNRTLFVAERGSISIPLTSLDGLKRNCIFCLDDSSHHNLSHDSGVFYIEDGRIIALFHSGGMTQESFTRVGCFQIDWIIEQNFA